jgi:hypothetical protein
MKKLIFTVSFLLSAGAFKAQGLYNNGADIVVSSGTYLVVDGTTGNFLNTTSGNDGEVHLTGTLKLGGNFTNNVLASDAFGTLATGSEVIFAGSGTQVIGGTSTATQNFDKITINSGATVQVTADKKVTAAGATANAGTFTLLSTSADGTATFIDNGTISGAGTFNAQQYLTGAGGATPNGRRWYLSSPVASALSSSVSAAGNNRLQQYNESSFQYSEITDNTTALTVTKGYVFRGDANQTVVFTGGAFNTGVQSSGLLSYTGTTSADRGFHILGNPYPSHYDWENATLTNVSSTFTYRTVNLSSTMVYDTYNGSTHIGTNNNGSGAVTQYIAPMQAFWVSVASAGTGQVDFANAGRSHQANKLRGNNINNILRFNITDGTNSDQLILNFNDQAQNTVEDYDSRKIFSAGIPQVYAPVEDAKLVINSLSEITEDTRIPVSVVLSKAGNYGFEATEMTGSLLDYTVYVEDKAKEIMHDLTSNPIYTFDAVEGETSNRFVLAFKKRAAGIEKMATSSIQLFNVNRQLNITLPTENAGTVRVIDMSGRTVASQDLNTKVSNIEIATVAGIYNVEVVSGAERIVRKIVIE